MVNLFTVTQPPAANYGEAQNAEARADYIHKMQLALKELRETRVWLLIIVKADLIQPKSKLNSLIDENNQLISIFVTSVMTARLNKNNKLFPVNSLRQSTFHVQHSLFISGFKLGCGFPYYLLGKYIQKACYLGFALFFEDKGMDQRVVRRLGFLKRAKENYGEKR